MKKTLNKHIANAAVVTVLVTSFFVPLSAQAGDGHQAHDGKKKAMEHMQMKDGHHGKENMMEMHMKMKAKMKACMAEKLASDGEANAAKLKENMLGHMSACMDGMMNAKMAKMNGEKHKKADHKKEDSKKHQH